VGRIVTFLLAPFAFAGTMCLGPTGAVAFERGAAGTMCLGPGAFGPNPSLGPTGAVAFERGAAGTMCLGPTGAVAFERGAAGAMGGVATSSIASTCSLFALLRDLALSSMAFCLGALNDRGLCLTSSNASIFFFTDLERALSSIASFVGVFSLCISVLADLERACLGSAFFADLVLARGVVVGASLTVVVSFGADLALDLLLALAAAAGLSSGCFFAFFLPFLLLWFPAARVSPLLSRVRVLVFCLSRPLSALTLLLSPCTSPSRRRRPCMFPRG
jgi:hypothetical protein